MSRIIKIIFLCCFVLVFGVCNSQGAWFKGAGDLVTINGVSFQPDDFTHWWDNWREKGMQFPEDPNEFIDWKLLVLEGKSMELDQEPSFNQKLRVFYKARTRVLLKYDAVDSKIQISDKDIEDRFQADYNPIWRLTILFFDSRAAAQKAYEEIKSKANTFEALKNRAASDGGPVQKQESNFRPINFKNNKEELGVIRNLSVGEVTVPKESGKYFVLIRLEELSIPGVGELQSKEAQIRRKLYDEKQAEYTAQLVEELKEKFAVQIDEDLLAQANPDMAGDILAKPIVKTSKGDLPLGMLVNDLRKEFNLRKKKTSWTDEEIKKLARGLLNGMTVEYLLTWEAEDRRYDEKPPFKWTYEFYKENRLIKELEQRLIASGITVSDAETAQYYQENIEEFRPPDILSLILVKGEEKTIKQLWTEVSNGQDIIKAAEQFDVIMQPMLDISAKFVAPEVIKEVDRLAKGEVSQPFAMGDNFYIVKLGNRRKLEPQPLEEVREDVVVKLKNRKFSSSRQEYLDMVRNQSEISLNKKAWQKLTKEMTD